MARRFFSIMLLVIMLFSMMLSGCGNNAGAHCPNNTAKGTIGANLTCSIIDANGQAQTTTHVVNWATSAERAEKFDLIHLNGECSISFSLKGDEKLKKNFPLSTITLTFSGGGKDIVLRSDAASLLNGEREFFKVEGSVFNFIPNYFATGETVVVKAEFTYAKDTLLGKAGSLINVGSETREGYFAFVVGEDTGVRLETSGIIDGVSGFIGDIIGSDDASGNTTANTDATEPTDDSNFLDDIGNAIDGLFQKKEPEIIGDEPVIEWTTSTVHGAESRLLVYLADDSSLNAGSGYPLDVETNGEIKIYARNSSLAEYNFTEARLTVMADADGDGIVDYEMLPNTNSWINDNYFSFKFEELKESCGFDIQRYVGQTLVFRVHLVSGDGGFLSDRHLTAYLAVNVEETDATETTEPATEATESASEATEPATEATEPATEATEPVTG